MKTNDENEITPAAEALDSAERDIRRINDRILREIESIRRTLSHVEERVRGSYHLDDRTEIRELDCLIARRQVHVEAQKLLRFALGRDA